MPLPEVMQWLANGRHTGTLVVTDGAVEKSLYLKNGAILSCTFSDPNEFLGHYLVSSGVVGGAMRRARVEIKAHLETTGLDPAGVPFLCRPLGEPRSLTVTPEQGFILSRVDGRIDVRSIVQISPLPEIDALPVLGGLIDAGHLELEFR